MGTFKDHSIIVQGSGARVRVWRTEDTKWHAACLTHGAEAPESTSRSEAAAKRLASTNWCSECEALVLAKLPPITPCCYGKKGAVCGRRAYYETTNIKDDVFQVCRMHVSVLAEKGVLCVPMEGLKMEGESTETVVRRAEYLRAREERRKVNKKKGVRK